MARAKASADVAAEAVTEAHDNDGKVSVERTEFSKAYRFASERDITPVDENGPIRKVGSGKYLRFEGTTNDDRVVVSDRNGNEYYAEINILDRVI